MEYKEGKDAHRLFLELETPELIKEVNRLVDKKEKLEESFLSLKEELKQTETLHKILTDESKALTIQIDTQKFTLTTTEALNRQLEARNDILESSFKEKTDKLKEQDDYIELKKGEVAHLENALALLQSESMIEKSKADTARREQIERKEDIENWKLESDKIEEQRQELIQEKAIIEQKIEQNELIVQMGKIHNKEIKLKLVE